MRMHICILERVEFNGNKVVVCQNGQKGLNAMNGRVYYHF